MLMLALCQNFVTSRAALGHRYKNDTDASASERAHPTFKLPTILFPKLLPGLKRDNALRKVLEDAEMIQLPRRLATFANSY